MTEVTAEEAREIEYDQWIWWCRDSQAVRDRNLGLANCLVCAQEPREVLAWTCGPERCPADHALRDVAHHAMFKSCGHLIDVVFSWEALSRVHG